MDESSIGDQSKAADAGCNVVPGSRMSVDDLDSINWEKCGIISDLTIVLSSDRVFGEEKAVSYPSSKKKATPMKPKSVTTDEVHEAPAEIVMEEHTEAVPQTAPLAPPAPAMVHPVPGSDGVVQILQNLPAGSSLNGLSLAMAAVAILGGGTAFKFYTQLSKQKHAERMKKLDHADSFNEENKKRCDGHASVATEGLNKLKHSIDDVTTSLNQAIESIKILDTRMCNIENKAQEIDLDTDVPARRSTPKKSRSGAKKPTTRKVK